MNKDYRRGRFHRHSGSVWIPSMQKRRNKYGSIRILNCKQHRGNKHGIGGSITMDMKIKDSKRVKGV